MVSVEELVTQTDTACWEWLKPHNQRGGIILVSNELNIAEVGLRAALNDADAIKSWIESGKIVRPSLVQIDQWDAEPGKIFASLIVSPYVFIQEIEP